MEAQLPGDQIQNIRFARGLSVSMILPASTANVLCLCITFKKYKVGYCGTFKTCKELLASKFVS